MRTLYHYPLDAFGRLIRIYLNEKNLEYESSVELPWKRKKIFSEYHVFSDLPTIVEKDGMLLEGWYAIIEHLEQTYRSKSFLGNSQKEKAETRRLLVLFNDMFFADVTRNLIYEKIMKKFIEKSSPDSASIRRGISALKQYMEHISWFVDHRNWLAGDEFSLADMAAAAQISCIDYAGSIEWDSVPTVKDWYVRVKSRPSFRDLLNDRVGSMIPPDYYSKLDF